MVTDPTAHQYRAFRRNLEIRGLPSDLAHDAASIMSFGDALGPRSEADQQCIDAAYQLLFRGQWRAA